MRTPPFLSKNLPIVGHTLEFAKDHVPLMQRGYKEKGSIFAFSLAGKNAVALIGPEYHKAFFEATDKQLSMEKAYSFMVPITGKVAFFAPHETYLNQRSMLYEPFKYRKSVKYVPIMQRVVNNCFKKLGENGELELTEYAVHLTGQVAGYSFMGEKFQAEMGEKFWTLYKEISASIDMVLPPNLPLPKFRRRDEARAEMQKLLEPVIAERKANPSLYDDFMQEFIQTPLADGSFVDNVTLVNFIVSLMFASHDTTSGHTAWTIIQLLQNPTYLAEVKKEIAEKFPLGTHLTIENIHQLEHIFWAIEETARMNPTADVLLRFVEKEWEVGSYTIPQGWLAFVAPKVAHFLPEVHENPEKYDPYRFDNKREEHKTCPYQQIGFGGAMHKCPGMSFAKNEMAIIIALLFRDFEVELLTPNPTIVRSKGTPRPSDTIIKYKRKSVFAPTFPKEFSNKEELVNAAAMGCPHAQKMQSTRI
jgi:sterol 14alpha-demethylase